MKAIKGFLKSKRGRALWETLTSPKTVSLLKLGIAVVGVIHAIEEFRGSSGSKQQIGFRKDDQESDD